MTAAQQVVGSITVLQYNISKGSTRVYRATETTKHLPGNTKVIIRGTGDRTAVAIRRDHRGALLTTWSALSMRNTSCPSQHLLFRPSLRTGGNCTQIPLFFAERRHELCSLTLCCTISREIPTGTCSETWLFPPPAPRPRQAQAMLGCCARQRPPTFSLTDRQIFDRLFSSAKTR